MTATEAATGSTWDFVYAQLAMLNLDEQQYKSALTRINTLRSLADTAVESVGKINGSLTESLNKQKTALDDLLKYVMEMIKWEVKNQIDGLNEQKKKYQDIVNLQKESLQLAKDKDAYDKSVSKKIKSIADLQAKINQLSLDDSREAQAEKKKLEQELLELQEGLADQQADYQYNIVIDTLDKEADAYADKKDKEIKILEDTISSYQKLYDMAISRISGSWDTLYNDLTNWNYNYGNVLTSEITSAWDTASLAVQQYGNYLDALMQTQKQLNALSNGSYSSRVVGNSSDYDSGSYTGGNSGANNQSYIDNQVSSLVAQMRANSLRYAGKSPSEIPNYAELDEKQHNLAAQVEALIGQQVKRGGDGVWYIGSPSSGKKLYDYYHTGIWDVGEKSNLKGNEVMAVLEKGEAVLTKNQKESMVESVSTVGILAQEMKEMNLQPVDIKSLYANYELFSSTISANGLNLAQDALKENLSRLNISQNLINNNSNSTPVVIENINVEAPMLVTERLTKEDIVAHSRTIADISLGTLKEGFTQRGVKTLKGSALRG